MSTRAPMSKHPNAGKNWHFKGANILKQAKVETEKSAAKRNEQGMYRFFLSKGNEAEVVILDKNMDEIIAVYEHDIPVAGPGNYSKGVTHYLSNRSENPSAIDPAEAAGESTPTYKMYWSVLDLTPYTTKDGKERKYSRKLLPIKQSMIEIFANLAEKAIAKNGTLRGLHFKLVRPDQDKSVSIGNPQPLDSLEYGFLSEAELIKRFGHPEIVGQNKKVVVPANGMLEPYDYEEKFISRIPTAEAVKQHFGLESGGVVADSQDWSVEEDVETEVEPEKPVKATKGKASKKAAPEPDEDDIPF